MKRPPGKSAFTLIELIVVMATLGAVLAVSAPSLSDFFKGRRLQEEARRVLALTRYAKNESISRAVQMLMWIDTKEGTYGLRPLSEYDYENSVFLEYQLPQGLQFEIEQPQNVQDIETGIFFRPDGGIGEYSLFRIVLKDEASHCIAISKADGGYDYIIEDDERDVGEYY